ncbi:hypothetical protein LTV02_08445 [Nocardia yamanashiensis]|uniref:hypothetical protein n=1 Tax=Nocardia yamanashiensis TaxID=209247 RepID=UPI001E5C9420|nr:hypothetical protein [Nocardia yamanashiensis]UGT43400.1 hypothetical protein LTV02_08445 [Nocardia yamanashiensis]
MRWGGIAVAATMVAVLTTGCGDSDSGSTTSQPKPSTPRAELLLTESDFPAGTKTEIIPAAQPGESTTVSHETVTPAGCTEDTRDVMSGVPDSSISAVAATDDDRGVFYAEAVIDRAMDIAEIKNTILGKCADITIRQGNSDIHLKFTAHQLPAGLRADQAVAYSTSGSSGAGSTTGIKIDAIALVRGMTVNLSAVSMDTGLDAAAFDKLFVAAVDKVASAK